MLTNPLEIRTIIPKIPRDYTQVPAVMVKTSNTFMFTYRNNIRHFVNYLR